MSKPHYYHLFHKPPGNSMTCIYCGRGWEPKIVSDTCPNHPYLPKNDDDKKLRAQRMLGDKDEHDDRN